MPRHPSVFTDALPLPTLLVFDLDYTLWPLWVDTHVSGRLTPRPSRASASASSSSSSSSSGDPTTPGKIVMTDRHGRSFGFYPDVAEVLVGARAAGCRLAVASRTGAVERAREALRGLVVPGAAGGWDGRGDGKGEAEGGKGEAEGEKGKGPDEWVAAETLFECMAIWPGDKRGHFEEIRKRTGVGFDEMVFFDDEVRNRNVEQLGVVMRLVEDGITAREVEEGVREWRRRKGRTKAEGKEKGGGLKRG